MIFVNKECHLKHTFKSRDTLALIAILIMNTSSIISAVHLQTLYYISGADSTRKSSQTMTVESSRRIHTSASIVTRTVLTFINIILAQCSAKATRTSAIKNFFLRRHKDNNRTLEDRNILADEEVFVAGSPISTRAGEARIDHW